MKRIWILLSLIVSFSAFAEPICDLAPAVSSGVNVIEFRAENSSQSKIPLNQFSTSALQEELLSLQDMGICDSKVVKEKCVLRFEKLQNQNIISMIRGNKKWLSWNLQNKKAAQNFVVSLKKVGFCS